MRNESEAIPLFPWEALAIVMLRTSLSRCQAHPSLEMLDFRLTDRQILQVEQIFQQQLTARIALQRDLERLELAYNTPSTEESLMTPPRCT
jgi:hypothetical protein